MSNDINNLVDDITTWATARMGVYAEASKVLMTKVIDGNYTGDELSKELAGAWARLAEDVSSFVEAVPLLGNLIPPADGTTPTPDDGTGGN